MITGLSDRKIKKYFKEEKAAFQSRRAYDERRFWETVCSSKAAFYESEAKDMLSGMEFLYQQGRYIDKYLWLLQGGVLLALWNVLKYLESGYYLQKCMGIGASLFAVLLLPELWKNRNVNAMEVECAACYSLRQIYSARILLCALADMVMLCVFGTAVILNGRMLLREMIIHFFLPYMVTCCICFWTLYSRKVSSEAGAVFLCMVWAFIWTEFVLNERIYGAVSGIVWMTMLGISVFYLGYCIYKGQKMCGGEKWN